jgi:hypothetical protein
MKQNREIERDLVDMLRKLTAEYPWLDARYEYSEPWDTLLVSYAPRNKIFGDGRTLLRMMELEDELRDKYGDDAPLFCEEERLFELSSKATLIAGSEAISHQAPLEWGKFEEIYVYADKESDYREQNHSYRLAA